MSRLKKTPIISVEPGLVAYFDLRFFDGTASAWFDSLNLPHAFTHTYVFPVLYIAWHNLEHTRITASSVEIAKSFTGRQALNAYEVYRFGTTLQFNPATMILVDAKFLHLHPQVRLWAC